MTTPENTENAQNTITWNDYSAGFHNGRVIPVWETCLTTPTGENYRIVTTEYGDKPTETHIMSGPEGKDERWLKWLIHDDATITTAHHAVLADLDHALSDDLEDDPAVIHQAQPPTHRTRGATTGSPLGQRDVFRDIHHAVTNTFLDDDTASA